MGILAAREISRFKGIGLCETTSVVSISKYRLFLPRSFLSLLRSVSHRGNDLAFISPSGPGIFRYRRTESILSLLLPFPPRPSLVRPAATSRPALPIFDKLLDKRDAISYHRHHRCRYIPDNCSPSSIAIFHILTETQFR